MKFLNSNLEEVINGGVRLEESCFGSSYTLREWEIWINQYDYYYKKLEPKIVLKPIMFRGNKFINKPHQVSKANKKYFAFSDKVINFMCDLENDKITKSQAQTLINLFEKRGFKDFEPDEEDLKYINGHISDGIDFNYWSDRCNFLRCKVILEYFKQQNLI